MAQIKIGDPHGLFRVFVGLVDENGYNFGTAGPGVAEGTLVSPYLIRYAQSAEIGLPDRTVIDFTGGDVWTGSYVYGITSLGTFEMTLSTVEAELVAFLADSTVDSVTNDRQTIFSDNIMIPTPPQAWMMIVFRIQSKEVGQKGANKFLTIILPRTWVSPKGISGAPAFQAAGTYGFTIVPTVGDRFPWGLPFSCTNLNLELDETPVLYIITDYPVHTVGYVASAGNATETITLPFKPVGEDIATPDSSVDPLQTYIDGRAQDADSVTVETGEVIVSPIAPAASFSGGEYIGVFYETQYEPTASSSTIC